jgi:hypothetical protein
MPTPQGWLHLSEGAPNCTYEFPQADASRLTIEFMYLGRLYHARRSTGKSDIFVLTRKLQSRLQISPDVEDGVRLGASVFGRWRVAPHPKTEGSV